MLPNDRPAATDLRGELLEMAKLALPIVAVQVGIMAMGSVDTMIVGRVSAQALAAVALGNLYFFVVSIFGIGLLLVLDPIISQAVGARDEAGIARGVQRGMILSVGVTVLASLAMIPAGAAMRLLHQPVEIIPDAAGYVWACIPGMLPLFFFTVLRQTMQAMRMLAPILITIIVANILNVVLNWVFVFGHLGFPVMGAVGSAWASTISRVAMALMLLVLGWSRIKHTLVPWLPESSDPTALWRMAKLGAPIGAQHQLEVGIFAVVALLMGRFGAVEMAAHQVAINIAALTFMIPMGVAAAASVLVGHGIGRGDMEEARRASRAAFVCGVGFMVVSAVAFLTVPRAIARAYTPQENVLALAATLIPIAGFFQVFDGLQAVAGGVLRGTGDTRAPALGNFVGFWVIGLPISIYLGFYTPIGPRGLWWGLVAGLAMVALFLTLRVRFRLRSDVARVVIDRH